MKSLTGWFQGSDTHDGIHNTQPKYAVGSNVQCLLLLSSSRTEEIELVDILTRLFPEDVCTCSDPEIKLIHFNDKPTTTYDMIEKIVHTWKIEHENE